MHIKLAFGLLLVFLVSCNDGQQNGVANTTATVNATTDTLVARKIITDEIAGAAYRKRAIGYSVVVGKDTSDYMCVVTESKDGRVGIDLNIPYNKPEMTYRQRFEELGAILPEAAKAFDFDSLAVIFFGRLILSGDLAVDVTKQYHEKFGNSDTLENYATVAQFLKESKLGTDLNALLKPYAFVVDEVSIEKLILVSRKQLDWASKIETDTTSVPDYVLDCITGVKLKKQE